MPEVNVMVDGGAAKAGAALGGALGPLGVNIQKVLTEINTKTQAFKGLQVPVTINVDAKTKNFTIEVGSPMTSQLIKAKAKLEKGSGKTGTEWTGNISMEDVKSIAEGKLENNISMDKNQMIKQIIGTCQSMGITIDGKNPKEAIKTI